MKETPGYIKSLTLPHTTRPKARKAWSIDLETVWIPFFTATNLQGDTAIPLDSLGAPLRLAYEKDGSVKFSVNGRPVVRIEKNIADSIRAVRENFTASIVSFTGEVITNKPKDYAVIVENSLKAGQPIIDADNANLNSAIAERLELEAQALVAQAQAQAQEVAEKEEKELVPA